MRERATESNSGAGSPVGTPKRVPGRNARETTGRMPVANFIGVVGLSPQVVSETLYCLAMQRPSPPAFRTVRLLTTGRGKELVDHVLLGAGTGALFRMQADYPAAARSLGNASIEVEVLRDSSGRCMPDIFTSAQSVAAADQIYRAVLDLAGDERTPLIASVAGGRKTMGIYLAMAMELAGRPGDRLLHVLVREPLDRQTEFHYPLPGATRGASRRPVAPEISLVELPFLRTGGLHDRERLLRGLRAGGAAGLLRSAQSGLERTCRARAITLDLARHVLEVDGHAVAMTPRELGFYWHLCALPGGSGDTLEGERVADLAHSSALRQRIRTAEMGADRPDTGDDADSVPARPIAGGVEGIRQLRSKINRKLRTGLPVELSVHCEIRSFGQRHDKRYAVPGVDRDNLRIVRKGRRNHGG